MNDRWVTRTASLLTVSWLAVMAGCARLPYETAVIQRTDRLHVALQRELGPTAYAHPADLTAASLSALLAGYSIRPQPSLPLRWYAEETPPSRLFRADEIQLLAPVLAEALRRAGPQERVAFSLFAPGMNPRYDRDVTGGWVALRGSVFTLTIEHFHSPQPSTRSSPYDVTYPTPPTAPEAYVLYFEPGRFWRLDETGRQRGVDVPAFLKSGEARP